MSEDRFPPTPTYNIPPEDWDHVRALTRYPPQIVLWMIRELLDGARSGGSANAPPPGLLPPPNMPPPQPLALTQTPVSKTRGTGQPENRWFCIFDEHSGTSFSRRADWKRHMNDYHKPGKNVWQCPAKDCLQIFDQASNFRQHHKMKHRCRKSCRHADAAKTRARVKQAFACGRESCQTLLFSWDEWRDHVAEHIEDGMAPLQWQYNTLFRNLLRRPEIHPHWEKFVADRVRPFNISARFTWRPRNTVSLKMQLEYNDESDLLMNADRIVLEAYETGTSVRSSHELSDPSALITEQPAMPNQPFLAPHNVSHQRGSGLSGSGDSAVSLSSLREEPQSSASMLSPRMGDLFMNFPHEQPFGQFPF